MPAPITMPSDVQGHYNSGDYVVLKGKRIICSTWCSLRAFRRGREERGAVYDGMSGRLIQDYT